MHRMTPRHRATLTCVCHTSSNDPMTVRRILMISSLWPPVVLGGAESYASALAEQLRARGGEVGVLTLGVGGADVVSTVSPWPYRRIQRSCFSISFPPARRLPAGGTSGHP